MLLAKLHDEQIHCWSAPYSEDPFHIGLPEDKKITLSILPDEQFYQEQLKEK